MIKLPWWWKLVAFGVVVLLVGLGFNYYVGKVYQSGFDAAVNARALADANKKSADTVTARGDEKKLRETKEAEQTARLEKEKERETYITGLETRVRTGAVSLSIATAAIRAGSAGRNSCPVTGPAEAERTDLMPETSIAFIGIARDSARDVRDYNALMSEYERIRAICNKGSAKQ
ncbi:MAG: hypothetical protein V4621_07440 [Pseudomonadota bacterium]